MRVLAALATVFLIAAAPARGDGFDVTIDNGDRVRGTIDPANQVDTFRLDLPAAARLSVLAKPTPSGRYRNPPPIRLRLLGPSLLAVGVDDVVNGQRRSKIKGHVVETSGPHRVELRGDGHDIGDYDLRVRFKTGRRQTWRDLAFEPLGLTVTFSAPGGTEVDIIARPEKGSSALPRIRKVRRDVPGSQPIVQPVIGLVEGKKHVIRDVLLRETGDYTVEMFDIASSSEGVRLIIKFHTPRLSKRRIGLREQDIGPLPGDVDVVVTVLARPEGTKVVSGEPFDADAARASLNVPAGALHDGEPVVIGLGPRFQAPFGSGLLPVGRPLYIGPDGLQLPQLATGTVGFDLAALDGDVASLRVVHRDASATITVFDAQAISANEATQTVTFPAGRAGAYGAFRRYLAPALTTLSPFVGGTQGGYEVSLFGTGIRTGDLPDGDPIVAVTMNGVPIDVTIGQIAPTFVTFIAPAHAAADVTFGLYDRETGLLGQLPPGSFEYR